MEIIETRFEASGSAEPDYTGRVLSRKEIAEGKHRKWIGGHWEDHGIKQLNFLQDHGLKPEHKLLDIGCGSFRAGRHFVDYLEAGNYYGIDANQSVMQAGYDVELTDEQRRKLPVKNLRASDRFGVDFRDILFDMALAQSVFTHISLNHIRLCLYRVAKVVRPGGVFYATFNERGPSMPLDQIWRKPNIQAKYTERNVFWYYRNDIRWASRFSPWQYGYIGRWGHPGGQRMLRFTRLPD